MEATNEKVFISPARYVQGEGVTARAGHYVAALGQKARRRLADDAGIHQYQVRVLIKKTVGLKLTVVVVDDRQGAGRRVGGGGR